MEAVIDEHIYVCENISLPNEVFLTMCNSSNDTSTAGIESAPILVTAIMLLIAAWIIAVNAMLIAGIVTIRPALRDIVEMQVLSLSASDVLVGISVIPVTMTFHLVGSFPYYGTCATIFIFYLTAQTASLFHLFGICIHRVVALVPTRWRPRANIAPRRQYLQIFVHFAIPWVLAFVCMWTIFQVFGVNDGEIHSCSLNTMFGGNYRQGLASIDGVWLSTQLLMTLAYLYLFIRVSNLSKRKRVLINNRGKRIQSNGILSTEADATPCTFISRPDNSRSTVNVTGQHKSGKIMLLNVLEYSDKKSNVSRPPQCTRDGTFDDMALEHRSTCLSVPGVNPDTAAGQSTSGMDNYTNSSLNQQNARTSVSRGRTWHKRVIVTIGWLLLAMNVFLTPYNCLMVLEFLNENTVSRKAKFLLAAFALLNSVLNPFIYAARIPRLWTSIKQRWCRGCRVRVGPATY